MKSFIVLAAMSVSFGLLVHQFSFWSVLGVSYMAAMALVALLAFTSRSSKKGMKQA